MFNFEGDQDPLNAEEERKAAAMADAQGDQEEPPVLHERDHFVGGLRGNLRQMVWRRKVQDV